MAPDFGSRRSLFRGLNAKNEMQERLSRFRKIKRPYVDPFEYLIFNTPEHEAKQQRIFPLSPEHRAYLSQVHRDEISLNRASKRFPFCDVELSDSAPRWKVAILTWIGLCLTVGILGLLTGPWMANWFWLTNLLIFNAVVVLLLTWLVMPLLTWLAQAWLEY